MDEKEVSAGVSGKYLEVPELLVMCMFVLEKRKMKNDDKGKVDFHYLHVVSTMIKENF